jgi:dihydroorotate dehydrogenase (fumarate)
VNVPADATPGDHAGGIVVSAVTDSGQVKLDRRIATRLYVRVKGELQALMTLGSLSANYEPSWNPFGGRVNMVFTLTNSGNVSLGAKTASQVTGIFGIPFSSVSNLDVPELLPGTSRTVTIPIEGVGQWMFLSASVDLVGSIDDDAINPGPIPTAKRDVMIFATPWAAIGLLILGMILFFWLRAKRRRDAIRAQEWLEYAAATAAEEAKAQPASSKATSTKTTASKPKTTTGAKSTKPSAQNSD